MLNTQALADKAAIGLSVLCALHCLLFPVAIILYPSYMSFLPDDEAVHLSILFIVIPISVYALTKGARIHRKPSIFFIGFSGLLILILALLLGHPLFGSQGEKFITLAGSFIVTFAHFKNYSICTRKDCSCYPESD